MRAILYGGSMRHEWVKNGRRFAMVIVNGSARSLQNQFMRGAPKEKAQKKADACVYEGR